MNIILFYHSLISDWNHGNAHFLRGIVTELLARGHNVLVYEPAFSWSFANLIKYQGTKAVEEFYKYYPGLKSIRYKSEDLNFESILENADIVIVHEWNDHNLVKAIGAHHVKNKNYVLLFHDTHHRSITDEKSMSEYELGNYDGVLAFGAVIKDLYLTRGWVERAWVWHEAADIRVFHPIEEMEKEGDLVWIGNWGDEERTQEIYEYFIEPVKNLKIKATVHGVRYPESALQALREGEIEYRGWLPNFRVPEVFAKFRVTVHIPRGPYAQLLPGIPTIRPFEALACGIPLVSAPWYDVENLFSVGEDYLIAYSGEEMERHIRILLNDREMADAIASHGRETIKKRHTCAHRVEELFDICREMGVNEEKLIQSKNK